MKKISDIIVIGFALFSMFFGAGNLVFPPYLGITSGKLWITGFIGFAIADIGLAIITIVTAAKYNGSINAITMKGGKVLGLVISTLIITCLGPLLAIPRTAATTFEVGLQPIFPGANLILTSIIFFLITLGLTIKPSKVIDIIGQFLTPLLLIALGFLIIKGITVPLGTFITPKNSSEIFQNGVIQGYQTMDALAAIAFAFVVVDSIEKKGYSSIKSKVSITLFGGMVASIGLILVYGGLAYIGASSSSIYDASISQTALIVSLTEKILGSSGKVVLGIIVSLACLTTAIGLTSSAANFYKDLFNGKIKYEYIVIFICIFSTFISNFGVSTIISLSSPILSLIYPVTIVLVFMNIFHKYIKSRWSYRAAVYTTLILSLINLAISFGIPIPLIEYLPLTAQGFNWIAPALLAAFIGNFIKDVDYKS